MKSAPLEEELKAFFLEVMPADPSVGLFFASGGLGRVRRTEVLQKVWLPRLSETLGNLLMVLNEHERLNLFSAVAASYFALCETSAGKVTVQVRTPSALTAPERDSLLRQLRQTLKQEASLEESVDPTLLGGMTLKVGDWVYDASVCARGSKIFGNN